MILKQNGFRVIIKDENKTIGKKIREGEKSKIPYLLVVGDKEMNSNSVAVRQRERGDLGAMKLKNFLAQIKKENEEHK